MGSRQMICPLFALEKSGTEQIWLIEWGKILIYGGRILFFANDV